MIRGNVDPVRRRRGNQLIALGMLAALALASYFAFHPSLPFTHGYRIEAIVRSANQLQKGSPVRIAGVDIGKVADISAGPGNTTRLTLDIDSHARPVHRDATLRIRTRVFLEGGFYARAETGEPERAGDAVGRHDPAAADGDAGPVPPAPHGLRPLDA